jgi:hypothetical protein
MHFIGNGRVFKLWRLALPYLDVFVVNLSHSRNALLREMGLAPSRITRIGRHPDG